MGTITEHLYGPYDNSIIWLRPPFLRDSSYEVFLQVLAEMPDQERQVLRIGKLPILRQQILERRRNCSTSTGEPTKDETLEIAATLSQFHKAWLEMASTTNSAGSDSMSRAHGLPHMARIWMILHRMGSEHLLDFFCASRTTDESLPLDILTLESILPHNEMRYPALFAVGQLEVVPPPERLAPRQDRRYQGSMPRHFGKEKALNQPGQGFR